MSQSAQANPFRLSETTLDERAQKWLDTLNEKVRPKSLATKYPRIVNRLALLWTEPHLMRKYIDEIVVDGRGDREGFPLDVLTEIATLRHFYDNEVHPVKGDVWSKILTQIH